MQSKQLKLENPLRLSELNPSETLQKIGLLDSHVVCDIGAGSGVFTLPAARITKNKVYALEISDEMLSVIGHKAKAEGNTNIELVKVKDDIFSLSDHSIDIALMVTVLHEIKDKVVILAEVKRILNDDGRLAIIEFHKKETPLGPPPGHRMGKDETINTLNCSDFIEFNRFDLADNFYCLVFKRNKA
ncbi:class I SAM-dependent methyltransferase [Desulfolucanica intricata]|uniref:class I SAM-dependent methyltransferase n=1 Tax=Desulfolucanica intricata TaxID=1285191 RepID=UPI00082F3390|nr:methyltransferase domain-containing protein [Desulfolucanica intricata]